MIKSFNDFSESICHLSNNCEKKESGVGHLEASFVVFMRINEIVPANFRYSTQKPGVLEGSIRQERSGPPERAFQRKRNLFSK